MDITWLCHSAPTLAGWSIFEGEIPPSTPIFKDLNFDLKKATLNYHNSRLMTTLAKLKLNIWVSLNLFQW